MNNITSSEKYLLKKIAAGDKGAFTALYNGYHDALFHFVLKFVKSPLLAEDIAQEVFIKVWETRKRLEDVHSFKAYLFTIARNHTFNILKRISHEAAAIGEVLKHYTGTVHAADENLVSEEYRKHALETLMSLPPQTRAVFRLCREEHKSYEEVATLLGISRNTVKKHIMRLNNSFKNLRTGTYIPFYLLLSLLK